MNQVLKYKSVLIGMITALELVFLSLFFIFQEIISYNFSKTPEELTIIIVVIIFRIFIMAGMTLFLFHRWFSQERMYFTDLTFLVGLYCYILIIGKSFDIFWVASSDWSYEILALTLLKVRYILILITMLPILYLGLGILLYSLSFRYNKLTEEYRKRLRLYLVIGYMVFGTIFIVISTSVYMISYVYPFVVLPTLVGITYIFIFAYRNQRLSQVNGLIIGVSFIWYAITSSLRPILTNIGTTKYGLWWLAEILDLSAFIIMFIGYLRKPKYVNS
ncbi:MAG: hypothetical protein ACOC35_11515 [Promethearchaeia archaeon]